jgi:hypothetical protein
MVNAAAGRAILLGTYNRLVVLFLVGAEVPSGAKLEQSVIPALATLRTHAMPATLILPRDGPKV